MIGPQRRAEVRFAGDARFGVFRAVFFLADFFVVVFFLAVFFVVVVFLAADVFRGALFFPVAAFFLGVRVVALFFRAGVLFVGAAFFRVDVRLAPPVDSRSSGPRPGSLTDVLRALPRPEPLFFPPPSWSFTVAHARRFASAVDVPLRR